MAAAFFAALMGIGLACAPCANGAKTSNIGFVDETFDAFAKRHGRSYKPDSAEYAMRLSLFEMRKNEVIEHNGKSGETYTKTLNQFSDLTDQEFKKYRGLRPAVKKAPTAASMLYTEGTNSDPKKDWTYLTVATGTWPDGEPRIPDQGSCGSCWAVTTAGMMEAHYEIKQNIMERLSAQDLVNCVPNPHACGGAGGCQGSTVELAMDYIKGRGLDFESKTTYTGADPPNGCSNSDAAPMFPKELLTGATGYTQLQANLGQLVQDAMFTHGPIALSVAGKDWGSYSNGVFNGCLQGDTDGTVIDHAVLGYGYTQEYWKIRNSWGANWGESGFIRLARTNLPNGNSEDDHCEDDFSPELGTGCLTDPDGSSGWTPPASVNVCGMCGILWDSVYPHVAPLTTLLQEKHTVVVESDAVVRKVPDLDESI